MPIQLTSRTSSLLTTVRAVQPRKFMLDRLAQESRSANNFDLLRIGAALMVLFAHSFDLMRRAEPFSSPGLSWGTVGVLIFFAISGFLVARSWDQDPRPGAFARRRMLRLWPGLLVSLFLAAFVLGPLVTVLGPGTYFRDPGTTGFFIDNAFMHSNYLLPGVFANNAYPGAVNGSLWTLPVEVQAYIAVAVIGLVSALTGRRWLMPIVGIGFGVLLIGAPAGTGHLVAFGASAAGAGGIEEFWGLLTGCFLVSAALYHLRRFVPLNWWLCSIAAGACVLVAIIAPGRGYAVGAVLTPYIVLCLAYRTHDLVQKPRWAGDYSYGVYIYAFPVQQTISHLVGPMSGWTLCGAALVPTLGLAVLSWRLVEAPALRHKRVEARPNAVVAMS